jgi:recombination protein RecR
MNKYSPILQDLIQAFKNLPGIGIKSAQRIVFYLLQHDHTEKAVFLSEAIQKSLETIQECQICRMYSEKETCEICDDSKRDPTILCIAIENTMQFKGRYFVLMGYLSPIDGIGSDELKIDQLEEIFKQKVINEIILATGTTVEGEATAAFIASVAETYGIKATRIAYGVPVGGELEYVDSNTLTRAIMNRSVLE